MFPTTHDITAKFLSECNAVIYQLLASGNEVLIVSKPHLKCIQSICNQFVLFKPQILFRFTVGAMDNRILSYWEPGAPAFEERLACLKFAFDSGYETSVSSEPLLDSENVEQLVEVVSPYVTDSIWIGKLNNINSRVIPGTSVNEINRIHQGQTPESIHRVYEMLKYNSKVRWKESYKEVLGLALAKRAGLDE